MLDFWDPVSGWLHAANRIISDVEMNDFIAYQIGLEDTYLPLVFNESFDDVKI